MLNKRLVRAVPESRKYIAGNVLCQWVSLLANIRLMAALTALVAALPQGKLTAEMTVEILFDAVVAVAVRAVCTLLSSRLSYLSSKAVKRTLRGKIYKKLLGLGASYQERVNTSEVVQVAVEGVDQLETYFGSYLPQFFYAMLAPLTLFGVLSFVNFPAALVLFLCVPLIPAAIVAVQRWAKKLLSKYWGQYTALGDTFLENLQGLTTLKIYQADSFKQEEMQEQSEKFRKITMKVLTMQLNSITIMDLIAYGGAALGVILAVTQFQGGHVDLAGCLLLLILSADFFLPMRLLGSFFHIAMNGMAASEKIFRLLDLLEEERGNQPVPQDCSLRCQGVRFSYGEGRDVLAGVDLECPQGSFVALVGESGCGKSTLASLLMGRNRGYQGSVTVGGVELSALKEESLLESFTYISHQSYLFKGTVEDNLRMGRPPGHGGAAVAGAGAGEARGLPAAGAGAATPRCWSEPPICRAGSASGWPWPGGCCTTARCIFLTRPPPTSTWRAKTTSWRKSALWQRQRQCCSSPTGWPTWWTRIASTCWTKARWRRAAPTRSCWGGAAPTAACGRPKRPWNTMERRQSHEKAKRISSDAAAGGPGAAPGGLYGAGHFAGAGGAFVRRLPHRAGGIRPGRGAGAGDSLLPGAAVWRGAGVRGGPGLPALWGAGLQPLHRL